VNAQEIDRLVIAIRFAATFADRAEAMQRLKAAVGEKRALALVYDE
jgi:hypothetical protein